MMGALLSYSIVGGLLMLAMFLAYRVFLAKEKLHNYNRGVLLLIYIAAFTTMPIISLAEKLISKNGAGVDLTNNIEAVTSMATQAREPMWGTVLIWIFIAGMVIVTAKTIITWSRLIHTIKSGERISKEGYVLVLTDDKTFAPFSWLRYVVISRADYNEANSAITTHELKHIACRHWIDLLIAQLVCIINWFNPAAWLMRDELMLVHEYQADMAVIDNGHNPREYQMLLIKKAVGSRFPSLANSLNHSKLKKRITMMYKEKGGVGRKFKALTLVPMLGLALCVAAVPAVRAAVTTISNSAVSVSKDSENASQTKYSVKIFKVTNINNYGNETTVTIKGEGLGNNLTVSGGTFTTVGKTYQSKSMQCNMTDGVAIIKVTFPFMDEWENSSMTITVNGEEVPFNLEKFFEKAQSVAVGDYSYNI